MPLLQVPDIPDDLYENLPVSQGLITEDADSFTAPASLVREDRRKASYS